MTTTLIRGKKEVAQPLTLDQRLVLTGLTMDANLDGAGVEFDVRTAPIEIPEILVDPLPATGPAVVPVTAAEVLTEAGRLISAHRWICGYVGNAATGYCVIGAIRVAAGGEGSLSDQAEAVLLNRIRAEQPDVLSIGAWNDAQSGPGSVIRMLGG